MMEKRLEAVVAGTILTAGDDTDQVSLEGIIDSNTTELVRASAMARGVTVDAASSGGASFQFAVPVGSASA